MINKINIKYVYETNIQQHDSLRDRSNDEVSFETVGFTFKEVPKKCGFLDQIRKLKKDYNKDTLGDFNWSSPNLNIIGRGFFFKAAWQKNNYDDNFGTLKVSFRASEYIVIKGKSLIRDYKIYDLLSE